MTSNPRRLLRNAALLVVGWIVSAAPATADAGQARRLLAQSLAALEQGRLTAARSLATAATRADPSWGLAHAIAARTALAAEDGGAAEAELARARNTGFDMRRARQLLGHARLLQGDARAALREANAADPRYASYAARVKAGALAQLGDPLAAKQVLEAAVAARPDDAATWAELGRFRREQGDLGGAIAAADRAVALDPNGTGALLLRAQLVRGQFGLVASLPWFEGVLKRDPDNYLALIDYAATLGDAGRAREMLAATRRVLAVQPGDPQALYLLAVLAARAGNYDLARAMMEKTGEALSGVPASLLLGATLDIEAGGYEQAVRKLRNLVGLQPMNITARRLLGLALLRSDAPRDALDVLKPVALRDDADSYTLTLAARAFERLGDRAMAAQLLDRAAVPGVGTSTSFTSDDGVAVLSASAAGDPQGAPATAIPLIRALIDSGDRAGALARAQAVASASPGAPAAAIVLGDTLTVLGRASEAVTAYQRAASIRFDEPTMLRLTGALDRAGRRREAANALALFLSQNPRNVAALRLAAHWQIAASEFDAAIDTLEGLRARLGDRDAALLAELALAYDGAGSDDAARSFAAAAYRLAPSNPAAADAYGWTLYGAGDPGSALQLLHKAVSIAPRHAGLRWHLAQVYAALGRGAEAKREAAAALSNPGFDDRAAAQKLVSGTA